MEKEAEMEKVQPTGRRSTLRATRAGALAAGTTLMTLLMTSPALAVHRDDGDDPGPGLSVAETLGLYVLTPLVIFGIIAGLVTLGHNRGQKQSQS